MHSLSCCLSLFTKPFELHYQKHLRLAMAQERSTTHLSTPSHLVQNLIGHSLVPTRCFKQTFYRCGIQSQGKPMAKGLWQVTRFTSPRHALSSQPMALQRLVGSRPPLQAQLWVAASHGLGRQPWGRLGTDSGGGSPTWIPCCMTSRKYKRLQKLYCTALLRQVADGIYSNPLPRCSWTFLHALAGHALPSSRSERSFAEALQPWHSLRPLGGASFMTSWRSIAATTGFMSCNFRYFSCLQIFWKVAESEAFSKPFPAVWDTDWAKVRSCPCSLCGQSGRIWNFWSWWFACSSLQLIGNHSELRIRLSVALGFEMFWGIEPQEWFINIHQHFWFLNVWLRTVLI